MFEGFRDRYLAFLRRGETDRPLIGCNAGSYADQRFPRMMESLPVGKIGPEDVDVNLFLTEYADLLGNNGRTGDDYPLVMAPFVYVPWMEAIMGCPIISSPNSLWAEPCVDDWRSWDWDGRALERPWAEKLIELMRGLVKLSDGRIPVAPTLMRGPSDIMAAMRGATRFSTDTIDFPDEVRRIARICADVWIEVGKAQLDIISECGDGYMAGDHGLRVWAPDKIVWLQEDAMALLSPELYRQFYLPEDRRIARVFPYTAFHLHGSALWAVDDLVAVPEIDVLELNFEDATTDEEGTFGAWKKIQAHKPLVIWLPGDEYIETRIKRIIAELPKAGVSIQMTAENIAEAKDTTAMALSLCAGRM